MTAERMASELAWVESSGRRVAYELETLEEGSKSCAMVSYRLYADNFRGRRNAYGEPQPLQNIKLSEAQRHRCASRSMLAPGARPSDRHPPRLPCCRQHFDAWLRMAPVEAVTLGVKPVRAYSSTWCSWPSMRVIFEVPFGTTLGWADVINEQLDVMVDVLLAHGLVNDDVAWLMRRNAWRCHGQLGASGRQIAGAYLPLEPSALSCAATVVAIHRGGADADAAVDAALEDRIHGAGSGEERHQALENIFGCLDPLARECARAPIKRLLEGLHVRGPEWQHLCATMARIEAEEDEANAREPFEYWGGFEG